MIAMIETLYSYKYDEPFIIGYQIVQFTENEPIYNQYPKNSTFVEEMKSKSIRIHGSLWLFKGDEN